MAENASARIAQNSDFWYVINPINMDFNAAEEHCISLKGHLASIHSTAEHDVVKELIRLHGFEDYHVVRLGGYRLPNTTTFIWNDQSAWDFNNWYPTQSKTADTVTMSSGGWVALHRVDDLASLCKVPASDLRKSMKNLINNE
ncbi:hypothetical protein QR680_014746 [Steinernema hermaphroditum]|uniref:C-type lectin domain-containing protein n=1 Tax=Steinernema hermaphroditum TaxID=289476 RepID=A0AA39ICJ7_9BILA|nr:hypothetical protein QR680_014746 [Steinernema hermaphroditum]